MSVYNLNDQMLHGLIFEGQLRCGIAVLTNSVREAQKRHKTDAIATITLGQAIIAACLAGSDLKDTGAYVSLSFQGNGPLRQVTSEYVYPGAVRGFVTVPQIAKVLSESEEVPQSVSTALGIGSLTFRKSSSPYSEPYTGHSVMVAGQIGEDLAAYYLESEQIPTAILLGVDLNRDGQVMGAGGILIQKMGGDFDIAEILQTVEERLLQLGSISRLISSGCDATSIFERISGTFQHEILDRQPISFKCTCTREKMLANLSTIAPEELKSILLEVGFLEVNCKYCSSSYQFKLEEVMS